ncbi:MAG: kynureninase [Candidatus Cyclobacteriaceae bacterium M2_1C_046]
MEYKNSQKFAEELDHQDPLKHFRDRFLIPHKDSKPLIYFTGNSLGLQPKSAKRFIEKELKVWAEKGVEGHFDAPDRPWMYYHKFSKDILAKLTGAKTSEVVSMNNLTTNLHLMMASFYQPDGKRSKIMVEADAFPSDHYAVESQIRYHGLDYPENLIQLTPRPGEVTLRTEDIIAKIQEHGEELALVLLGGIQYYTGQFFKISAITKAAHQAGAKIGFDLAHAIGNVPLNLHDDEVDFAVWCSYKYLNSGPGGVSGVFVHEKYAKNVDIPRFAGWWGHDEETRFMMQKGFKPMPGADGWQLSNYNILSGAAHLASLEIFDEAGISNLRMKSEKLTGYMEYLIKEMDPQGKFLKILTPANPMERGCQLSLKCIKNGKKVFNYLIKNNVMADWREPEVIRVAPVPLYNTFKEVYTFVQLLKAAFDGQK